MSENFAELLEDYLVDMQAGEIVDGTVVQANRNSVLVDVGFKSLCAVSTDEFKDFEGKVNVQVGDKVSLFVEEIDDGDGEAVLSREKAKNYMGWELLENAFKENKDVKAVPYKVVRGGLVVDLNGIQGFLPISLIDTKPVKDASFLLNNSIDVKIVKLDKDKNSILVSRKASLANVDGSVEDFLNNLKEGDVVEGVVKNITNYGVFVDLGGVDGLLHITDMSWTRIESPHNICKMGQRLKMKVVKYDTEKKRISLSLKEMNKEPWNNLVKNYKLGDEIEGKVSKITDYGVFVNLNNEMEGLIHNTEISWNAKNPNPEKMFNVGDMIKTKIVEIDEEKYRVSLSYKRVQENPWDSFKENHKTGDVVKGSVKKITDFGTFINLEGDIEGVVSQEEYTWSPLKEDRKINLEVGQEVEAVVLNVDVAQEKILLSFKALTESPLENYIKNHKDNSVMGKVVSVSKKTVTVKLDNEVYGLLRSSEAGMGDDDLRDVFKSDEELKVKVIGKIDEFVNLSLKALAS